MMQILLATEQDGKYDAISIMADDAIFIVFRRKDYQWQSLKLHV